MDKMRKLFKMFLIVTIIVLALAALVAYISTDGFLQFGARPHDARLERINKSPQYDGGKFVNSVPVNLSFGFTEYRRMLSKWFSDQGNRVPHSPIPIVQLTANSFTTEPAPGVVITWLGHSTVLIEIDGYRILTDPMWSRRCSPSSLIGPSRFHPVPVKLAHLPPLDAVLITHDHYDHLDKTAIGRLAETGVPIFVPLGVGAHLEKWGIDTTQFTEYDWWESDSLDNGGLRLVATPARHFSGRGWLGQANSTLWVSWVIMTENHRVFFSGDTGEFPGLRKIGEKFGPFDLTCMKIAAYDPMWPGIHLNPEQAVAAHQALDGNLLMPIHWGTFNLAFHDWFEPPERLLEAAERANIQVIIPRPGQTISLAEPPPIEFWWRLSS